MSIVILVLGVLTAATGALMIGFGIPINEFSLGNTLIVAGTTALVGGLIVIALAVATRHLMRISAMLHAQARPARAAEGLEPASPGGSMSGPLRGPFPLKPQHEASPREPSRGHDPRFAPPPEPPSDPIFERLRMSHPGAHPTAFRNGEPPLVADEEAPLSPRALRLPIPPAPPVAAEPAFESRASRLGELRPVKPASEKGRNGAAAPLPSTEPRGVAFEDAWPTDAQPQPAESHDAFARDAIGAASPTRLNGESAQSSHRASETAAVTILKSGVVDGMAYTLYTDGSIEAELAQGVVRFGSIEELRNHLEKNA